MSRARVARWFELPLVFALATLPAAAEVRTPKPSLEASSVQTVGVTTFTLAYHRPAVRGRIIWGELVPFGEVWRLGANQATTLESSDPFRFGETEVPAGRYALFAIPGREKWTFVLNRDAEQWGAFRYDATRDASRVAVAVRASPHTEWMSLAIVPVDETHARIEFAWEKLAASIQLSVDTTALAWESFDDQHLRTLRAGAQLASETGERAQTGLQWIDEALRIAGDNPVDWVTRAMLLHHLGRRAEALALMDRAIGKAVGDRVVPSFVAELRRKRGLIAAGR